MYVKKLDQLGKRYLGWDSRFSGFYKNGALFTVTMIYQIFKMKETKNTRKLFLDIVKYRFHCRI